MNILIVSATELEIEAVTATIGRSSDHHHTLITGVGMVATAAHCARALSERAYDFALNLGVCGSFDAALTPATVVHVIADQLVELGAEDGDRFLSLAELGLVRDDELTELVNDAPPGNAILKRLPQVRGITVNTVHG